MSVPKTLKDLTDWSVDIGFSRAIVKFKNFYHN